MDAGRRHGNANEADSRAEELSVYRPSRCSDAWAWLRAEATSISTRDSGDHGGNMDYNQIQEGTTVYLPVFHPGALLFVGDGHAAQGDGELTGDALETSMDIEFQVDVLPRQRASACLTPRTTST